MISVLIIERFAVVILFADNNSKFEYLKGRLQQKYKFGLKVA